MPVLEPVGQAAGACKVAAAMSQKLDDLERVLVESRAAWRDWLSTNHQRKESLWLVTWKKASGDRHVPYTDLRDEALCFGWIDSLPRKLDESRSMLLMSPRRQGSAWSAVNKRRIEALVSDGLMTQAGLAAIQSAKQDGSWNLLDAVDPDVPPADLTAALQDAGSMASFQAFAASSRRAIIEWITLARRPQTRALRIAETARLAALGLRANHPESRGR